MSIARIMMIMLLSLCALSARAEELSAGKRADIQKLLQMTGAMAIGAQMSEAVVAQMTDVLRKARPDIPERILNLLRQEVNAVIGENVTALEELTIAVYHRHFNQSEIKGMIAFYSTPLGQKTIQVMPVLMRESMDVGQRWGRGLGPTIEARIRGRLQSEGYTL